MIKSSQPRKQRKFRFTADMQERQRFAHAHIAKELKTKLGIKKRAVQIRKGDTIKVMIGKYKGKTGKINKVNLKRGIVFIDGIVRKNAKGKELLVPVKINNVYITDLDISDKFRKEKLGIK